MLQSHWWRKKLSYAQEIQLSTQVSVPVSLSELKTGRNTVTVMLCSRFFKEPVNFCSGYVALKNTHSNDTLQLQ